MSPIRPFLVVIAIGFIIPIANAACPDPELGRFPGWAKRFDGVVAVNGIAEAEDFEVKLIKIISEDAVSVEISRLGSFYSKGSVEIGRDGILKNPDVWVELTGGDPVANTANLTLYTPQRANVTVNLTEIFAFKTISERHRFFPNEEFQMEFTINNSGELPAKNVVILPEFGDFQVLYTDVRNTSLCQGSTYNFKYVLKTPDVRKPFNYTLYLRIEYTDENIQIPRIGEYSEISSVDVEIIPAVLEITRTVTNWTTASVGRDLTVEVILNNTGESRAYNVKWGDTPPLDFLVTSGSTSWEGSLEVGSTKYSSYKVISEDPIICRSISTATYEDRFGNEYIAFSNAAIAKFAPYLTLSKKLDGISYFLSPDKSEAHGAKTIRLGETYNITITVKNIGNAIARNVNVSDSSGRPVNGTNRLIRDLKPGEEASFSYIAEVDKKDLNVTINMSYLDLDPDAFNESRVIEEETPNYCSRELKTVTYSIMGNVSLNILFPDVNITSQASIDALSEFEVEYNLTIRNNGTDGAHDVFIFIDTSDLRRAPPKYGGYILKGQSLYFIKELGAGEERNFTLIIRSPTVENKTSFLIMTRVNYTDALNRVHTLVAPTTLNVVKPKPAFVIIKVVEKGLNFTISAPNETEIGEYGGGTFSMENIGFSPLEKIELSLSLPPGVELFSNDTRWEGRFEAQLRRENQTWFGFVEDIVWKGNLSTREERNLDFLLRGTKAGLYNISYNLTFDNNFLMGVIELKVRGARLEVTKSLDDQSIILGEVIKVKVEVRNVGEAVAKNVRLVDKPPANFKIEGDITTKVEELNPGEAIEIVYKMKPNQAGSYSSGVAVIEWEDELGNEYLLESKDLGIDVKEPIVLPELTKPPETTQPPVSPTATPAAPTLTKSEVVLTAALTVIIMTILIRLLTLSRAAAKE